MYTHNNREYAARMTEAIRQAQEQRERIHNAQGDKKYDLNFVQCGMCLEHFVHYELNENLICQRCVDDE